ncbi:hypothetical protein JAAARDRAFT_60062 [Jaapia argillacea MUCL 33604]|uniref:Uncharacterized protein n=1 Tax=Jaapia argillacea MUCL 33604 TaxID=933084 RepID=A0A067PJK1_9AGAM|nr:hypothetical protein JAAARDRAFT_60062 [Jaapia argillacea MUCL 33604]
MATPPPFKVPNATPSSLLQSYSTKALRPPIHNPYDKFTQPQFDAWIDDITGALKKALGREDVVPPPPPSTNVAASQEAAEESVAHLGTETELFEENQEDEDEVVDDSFAEIRARRKGKARDPREGPGLGVGGKLQPIEILSDSHSEEEGSGEEGSGSEEEGEEEYIYDEGGLSDDGIYDESSEGGSERLEVESHGEGTSKLTVEVFSEEEDEEDPEGRDRESYDEEYDEETGSSPPRRHPRSGYRRPPHQPEEILEISDDERQEEDEEEFPPPSHARSNIIPAEISDPWTGPRTFAEDFYSGGDRINFHGADPSYLTPQYTSDEEVEAEVNPPDGSRFDEDRFEELNSSDVEDVEPSFDVDELEPDGGVDDSIQVEEMEHDIDTNDKELEAGFDKAGPDGEVYEVEPEGEVGSPGEGEQIEPEAEIRGLEFESDIQDLDYDTRPGEQGGEYDADESQIVELEDHAEEVDQEAYSDEVEQDIHPHSSLDHDTSERDPKLAPAVGIDELEPAAGRGQDVEIVDPWAGPSTYAEDFYSGGDRIDFSAADPSNITPRHESHGESQDLESLMPSSLPGIDELEPEAAEQAPTPDLLDPWVGPRTYAEDFYAGGDVLHAGSILDPSVLTPRREEEEEEDPNGIGMVFTPGVITPESLRQEEEESEEGLETPENGPEHLEAIDAQAAEAPSGHLLAFSEGFNGFVRNGDSPPLQAEDLNHVYRPGQSVDMEDLYADFENYMEHETPVRTASAPSPSPLPQSPGTSPGPLPRARERSGSKTVGPGGHIDWTWPPAFPVGSSISPVLASVAEFDHDQPPAESPEREASGLNRQTETLSFPLDDVLLPTAPVDGEPALTPDHIAFQVLDGTASLGGTIAEDTITEDAIEKAAAGIAAAMAAVLDAELDIRHGNAEATQGDNIIKQHETESIVLEAAENAIGHAFEAVEATSNVIHEGTLPSSLDHIEAPDSDIQEEVQYTVSEVGTEPDDKKSMSPRDLDDDDVKSVSAPPDSHGTGGVVYTVEEDAISIDYVLETDKPTPTELSEEASPSLVFEAVEDILITSAIDEQNSVSTLDSSTIPPSEDLPHDPAAQTLEKRDDTNQGSECSATDVVIEGTQTRLEDHVHSLAHVDGNFPMPVLADPAVPDPASDDSESSSGASTPYQLPTSAATRRAIYKSTSGLFTPAEGDSAQTTPEIQQNYPDDFAMDLHPASPQTAAISIETRAPDSDPHPATISTEVDASVKSPEPIRDGEGHAPELPSPPILSPSNPVPSSSSPPVLDVPQQLESPESIDVSDHRPLVPVSNPISEQPFLNLPHDSSSHATLYSDPYPYSLSTPGSLIPLEGDHLQQEGGIPDGEESLEDELPRPANGSDATDDDLSGLELAYPESPHLSEDVEDVLHDIDAEGEIDPDHYPPEDSPVPAQTTLIPDRDEQDPFKLMGSDSTVAPGETVLTHPISPISPSTSSSTPEEIQPDRESSSMVPTTDPTPPQPIIEPKPSVTSSIEFNQGVHTTEPNSQSLSLSSTQGEGDVGPDHPGPVVGPQASDEIDASTRKPPKQLKSESSPEPSSQQTDRSSSPLSDISHSSQPSQPSQTRKRKRKPSVAPPRIVRAKPEEDHRRRPESQIPRLVKPKPSTSKSKGKTKQSVEDRRPEGLIRKNSGSKVIAQSSQNGSRASSVASTAPSNGSSRGTEPSPSLRLKEPTAKRVEVPRPPLFHKHSIPHHHHRPPVPVPPQPPTKAKQTPSAPHPSPTKRSAAAGSSSRPSTAVRNYSSPVTRSNCRFRRISLPKDEDGPRIFFVVPGCSLGDAELMEEEEITDHGDATLDDYARIVKDIESLDFNLYLIGVLRQLVGVDLIREQEVFYLPQPGEEVRRKHRRRSSALTRLSSRDKEPVENQSGATAGSPQVSDASMHSKPPSITANAPSSSAASLSISSQPRQRQAPDASSDIFSEISDPEEQGGPSHSQRSKDTIVRINPIGPPNGEASTSASASLARPLKSRRSMRLKKDATEYKPGADTSEYSSGEENGAKKPRGKSALGTRGVKRDRPRESEVAGEESRLAPKKLKVYTSSASNRTKK